MSLMRPSSPHTHSASSISSTSSVMRTVVLATLPGLIALTHFFGVGSILNLLLAIIFCLGFETLALKLRKKPVLFYLGDYSALVTAILLALAVPPYAPWWLIATGSFFAIVVAKHLYGGLGFNPFNPAMVGYVVLLISFPVEMTQWRIPAIEGLGYLPLLDSLNAIFAGAHLDGFTSATPLDAIKHNQGLTVEDLYATHSAFQSAKIAGTGWEWVNIGFLVGGLYLLYQKVFTWHAPVGMLAALFILPVFFYDGGSSASAGSPFFHLFSGATMLGAFFIITDPVTSATSTLGRLIYGAAIGALVFIIRVWGNYPDAVAFAVLLMNFAAPFIDYYTVPRTYGHERAQSALRKEDEH